MTKKETRTNKNRIIHSLVAASKAKSPTQIFVEHKQQKSCWREK